ncbi:MAG TPA: CbbX protein [Steroidobacter sp.]|jgi:probable Rubsico expression protein CbbX|nr:CbbX protein [Steroidobacteraceae bacterium]HLS82366.1 CbbX protein [Steroidobacter sp.]
MQPTGQEQSAQGVDLQALLAEARVNEVLEQLDAELVGLAPVKQRVREISAFLLVARAREMLGIQSETPSMHMCFTGNPGTGKTTVATRMADILQRLGCIRRSSVVAVTRDDLVGQYIGHTAPKTKEVLKRAMGGVLFIDEAYYLYRPENERDYGQEAIEILLQVMEANRSDLVVILAGYKERMQTFFSANPGVYSRIAHHIDFPDYSAAELLQIAEIMAQRMRYRFDDESRATMQRYIQRRIRRPNFSNARSIRNALDRARLRQANRLFECAAAGERTRAEELTLIHAQDLLASRVFRGDAE